MGGFGMNSGVGDAASLGWLLAGVHQGWLAEKVLDVYGFERSSLGEKVAMQAVKWGQDVGQLMRVDAAFKAQLLASAQVRAEHNLRVRALNTSEWQNTGMMHGFCYAGSPLIEYDDLPAPEFVLDSYQESSSPGVRAPHFWREGIGGKPVSNHDQFGKGFTLLRIGVGAPSGAALIAAAQTRGVPLSVLEVPELQAIQKYQGYGLAPTRDA